MIPKSKFLFASAVATAAIFVSYSAHAAPITKADNADALNLTTSWNGGVVPGSSDIATWDSTVTAANSTVLGADTSWSGIAITNPGGAVTIGAGNILTLGASGIDMSAATQNLTLASGLLLNTAQTWNVATGRTLTISGASTGSTGSVTKSGAGNLQLNSALLASGGFTLAGGTTTSAAGNFVNSFGGTLTFQNGAVLTNGNGNNTMTLQSNIVVATGQSGTINMGSRIGLGSSATTFTLTGGGTLTLNANTTVSRDDIFADMTAFTGTINFTGSGGVRLFINGGKVGAGFTNSTVDLAGSVALSPQTNGGGNTINIGALTGSSTTASLAGGNAGTATYSIGGLNLSTTYAGLVTGNAAITKVGTGSLNFTNTNTYTGATNVIAGTFNIGNDAAFGTGTLNLGGTAADTPTIAAFGAARTLANNVALLATTTGNATISGANNLTLTGTLTNSGGNRTLSVNNTGVTNINGVVNLSEGNTARTLTINGSGTTNVNGVVGNGGTGASGLTYSGTGAINLNAANTYTGATTISGGVFALGSSGAISSSQITVGALGTYNVASVTGGYNLASGQTLTNNGVVNGAVTVASGASIGGSGTFNSSVTVNGGLNPGNSPGQLNFASGLTLGGSSTTTLEIAGVGSAGVDYDFINVTGTLALGGNLNVIAFGGFNPEVDGTYNLFDATITTGNFTNVNVFGATLTNSGGVWSGTSGGGSTLTFTSGNGVLSVVAVPEPSALLLGAFGALTLLSRRRRVA